MYVCRPSYLLDTVARQQTFEYTYYIQYIHSIHSSIHPSIHTYIHVGVNTPRLAGLASYRVDATSRRCCCSAIDSFTYPWSFATECLSLAARTRRSMNVATSMMCSLPRRRHRDTQRNAASKARGGAGGCGRPGDGAGTASFVLRCNDFVQNLHL
jgi:hypothetical protein